MRIIDQNISLYAHNQSLSRVQKSEQLDEFVGGRLVSQQTKSLDSINQQSATYRTATDGYNSVEDRGLPSKRAHDHGHEKQIRDRESGNPLLGSALNNALTQNSDRVTLSQQSTESSRLNGSDAVSDKGPNLPPRLLQMIEAIEAMLEKMSGKKTTLQIYGYNTADNPPTEGNIGFAEQFGSKLAGFEINQTQSDPRVSAEQVNLKGSRLTVSHSYEESEATSFRAAGSVTTADGKNIDFEMSTQMSRQFYSASHMQVEKGFVLQDPLVVNFGGQPASLSVDKVKFDLDSDGELENISFINTGSGFLFLDRNQDGQVNNGKELFGTESGDGFADLRQFDEDQNGWIDENDSIFSQLQIWHKNSQGMEELSGLLSLNVGAIHLQNVESPFTLKDNQNQTQGQVVSSGIFLSEDGRAGSVQQIDLAV